MKILFNTPNPTLKGGPPTHLPWLEAELRKQVEVIPFEYGRKSDSESLAQKVLGRAGDYLRVRRLLRFTAPDLIHHNSAFDPRAILRDAPLAGLARRFQVPLFIKIHGSLPEAFSTTSPLIQRLRDQLLRDVHSLGVLSESEKQEFEHAFPVTRGKVHVVKNILKDDFFNVVREESVQPTVLFMSRCIRRKGVFDFLNAVPQVAAAIPNVQFIIVGDGEDAAEVDRVIRDSGLASVVRREAHCSNAQTTEYYRQAHVFVFPTHFPEGMPMVIAEAMAAGTPIITTRTRFSQSYMQDGRECLFIRHGDSDDIAFTILRLLRNPALRSDLSQSARSLATRFKADAVAAEYLALYEEMLATSSIARTQRPEQPRILREQHYEHS